MDRTLFIKNRAIIAKEKGLEPLAAIIMEQKEIKDILEIAAEYISDKRKRINFHNALQNRGMSSLTLPYFFIMVLIFIVFQSLQKFERPNTVVKDYLLKAQ